MGQREEGRGTGRSQAPSPRTPAPEPLREEDECWVCHKELPSNSLPDWETLRQNHVLNCILEAERGPSSPPVNSSTQISPAASSSRPPVLNPSASTPVALIATVMQAGPSSAAPMRRSGCFPYIASEKDCVDDAECTICMEEYEVGDKMGRLECFCRFHLQCIRDWFVLHPGQCPVHQHGAGY